MLTIVASAACASAFSLQGLVNQRLSPRLGERRTLPVRANEYDDWWNERRARSTLQNGKLVNAPDPTETLQLERDNIVLVLSEFVRSDYARVLCNHCQVSPTDYGKINGMFEQVQLGDGKVVVRLKRVFETNEGLMDRCAKYLRARIPQVRTVELVHRDGRDIYS